MIILCTGGIVHTHRYYTTIHDRASLRQASASLFKLLPREEYLKRVQGIPPIQQLSVIQPYQSRRGPRTADDFSIK